MEVHRHRLAGHERVGLRQESKVRDQTVQRKAEESESSKRESRSAAAFFEGALNAFFGIQFPIVRTLGSTKKQLGIKQTGKKTGYQSKLRASREKKLEKKRGGKEERPEKKEKENTSIRESTVRNSPPASQA
jgi:hypothetical protein